MRSRIGQARALLRLGQASPAVAVSAVSRSYVCAADPSRRLLRASPSKLRSTDSRAQLEESQSSNKASASTSLSSKSSSSSSKRTGQCDQLAQRPAPFRQPPPASLPSVAWESFFAGQRPLLEHELLPRRSRLHHTSPTAALEESVQEQRWRRKAKRIEAERFAALLETLSSPGAEERSAALRKHQFYPTSSKVAQESARLEAEEVEAEERENAKAAAIERGEDPEVAVRLGAEADLVVLGEPEGPNPEWSRGVATYLAEKTRAFEPPAPPARDGLSTEVESSNARTSVFVTDDDPNLLLSHALVQNSLPMALEWDRLVAQMDAVVLGEPGKAREGVKLAGIGASGDVNMDSVKRKRRKKIRKHK